MDFSQELYPTQMENSMMQQESPAESSKSRHVIKEIRVFFDTDDSQESQSQENEDEDMQLSQDLLFPQSQHRLQQRKQHSNKKTSTSKRGTSRKGGNKPKSTSRSTSQQTGIQTEAGDVKIHRRTDPSSNTPYISLTCTEFTGEINLESILNTGTKASNDALMGTESDNQDFDSMWVDAMQDMQKSQERSIDDKISEAQKHARENVNFAKSRSTYSPANGAVDPTDVSPASNANSVEKKAVSFAEPLHSVMNADNTTGRKHRRESEPEDINALIKSQKKLNKKNRSSSSTTENEQQKMTEDGPSPYPLVCVGSVLSVGAKYGKADKYEMQSVKLSSENTGGKAPSKRWGHRCVSISNKKLLVYGGETSEDNTAVTDEAMVAKGDTHLFDIENMRWENCTTTDGEQRAWHGLVSLGDRAFAFGGERQTKLGTEQCTSAMFFDTMLNLWYRAEDAGTPPTARAGHSLCVVEGDGDHKASYKKELSGINSAKELQQWISEKIWQESNSANEYSSQKVVAFGGIARRKWTNELFCLDVDTMKWRVVKPKGTAPSPRCYHSAVGMGSTMVVFGGNDEDKSFNDVYVLDTSTEPWVWVRPCVVGEPPQARTGHVALKVSPRHILVTGGWDPNAEGDALTLFNDSFLLDCEEWEWIKIQSTSFSLSKDGAPIAGSSPLATGRTGHSGVTVNLIDESGSLGENTADFINPACVVFGGVKEDECRHNDIAVLMMPTIVRDAWDSYFQDVNPRLSVSPIPMANLDDIQ
eukprot:gb/GECG01004956.1/.p1 GENE.gb/GECG01004956.1/~~gb/GECG01004956.1/.p1  ORF type:complete len:758 (+),score=125.10 gb/GECG01004956.1/:1-2274(+)